MKSVNRQVFLAAIVLTGIFDGRGAPAWGQSGNAGGPSLSATGSQASGAKGGAPEPAQAVTADARTEKQKALARQTERLFDMATELKVQVDKTNKNILSMKVVEKAEEIEMLAKGMKEQARR